MDKSLKWRAGVALAVLAVCIIYLVPTTISQMPSWWSKILPGDKLRLGLDLKGGMHLVLGVQLDKAVETSTERTAQELKGNLRRKRLAFTDVQRRGLSDIVVTFASGGAGALKESLAEFTNFEIKDEKGDQLLLSMRTTEISRIHEYAIKQGRETIQNRVDQFGVTEATISEQGTDRLVVELPGIKDPQRAITLIGKTALLEFKMIDEEHSLDDALKGNVPSGSQILYEKDMDPVTGNSTSTPYLVRTQTVMTGDLITDAKVEINSSTNQPYVALEFNKRGARLFGDITGENVGKRMAIILDNNIYSAPVIREKIPEGRASISGRFTMDDAKDLAIVLRAGALPAPVEILENRTVGASLGADLIRKGIFSVILSSLLVVGFMIAYYKMAGLVADIAVIFNLVIILATLAGFKAALTMPGIAGLVLTVGMAVDANVLINERIREELRGGRGVAAAVDVGYKRAFTAIFDGHVTTIIAALVLWSFGTGPIRGFAVVLFVGLLSSLFTAVFVTRIIADYFVYNRKVARLSI